MARKYVNPNHPPTLMTDQLLAEARERGKAAAERVRAAERADPATPGWDQEYEMAEAAARAAARRVEGLERLCAAQLERSGKRAEAVKAAGLEPVTAGLAASRDAVAAAAAEHLRALASLASAAEEHNRLLAQHRTRLAELGLRIRDDLVDEGQEHAEGVLDGPGLRAGGTSWTPVPAAGVAVHALRLVFDAAGGFRGPFSHMRGWWRAHEVESRPDGLKIPSLEDTGATLPPGPVQVVMPSRAAIQDVRGPANGR
jgi:hypothetical protein